MSGCTVSELVIWNSNEHKYTTRGHRNENVDADTIEVRLESPIVNTVPLKS